MFLEPVYQEALAFELKKHSIPFVKEKVPNIYYDGMLLTKKITDLIC